MRKHAHEPSTTPQTTTQGLVKWRQKETIVGAGGKTQVSSFPFEARRHYRPVAGDTFAREGKRANLFCATSASRELPDDEAEADGEEGCRLVLKEDSLGGVPTARTPEGRAGMGRKEKARPGSSHPPSGGGSETVLLV